jgi:hypothetical protein
MAFAPLVVVGRALARRRMSCSSLAIRRRVRRRAGRSPPACVPSLPGLDARRRAARGAPRPWRAGRTARRGPSARCHSARRSCSSSSSPLARRPAARISRNTLFQSIGSSCPPTSGRPVSTTAEAASRLWPSCTAWTPTQSTSASPSTNSSSSAAGLRGFFVRRRRSLPPPQHKPIAARAGRA